MYFDDDSKEFPGKKNSDQNYPAFILLKIVEDRTKISVKTLESYLRFYTTAKLITNPPPIGIQKSLVLNKSFLPISGINSFSKSSATF